MSSSTGAALRGASVCVLAPPDAYCTAPQCSVSDDSGHFELQELTPEPLALVASAPGHLSQQHHLPGDAELASNPQSLRITLHPGGAAVAGNVVDATGGPVPAALVTLRTTGAQAAPAVVTTDADGQFKGFVPEGEVEVSARAEAYSQAMVRARAPAAQLTLVLAPGSEIRGRVIDASSEAPVPGVTLVARSPHSDTQLPSVARSTADGEFRLSGLAGGGWYHVSARSEKWRGAEEWIDVAVGQASAPLLVHVVPATVLSGAVKRAGEACPEALVTVSGPVSEADHSSASGAVRIEGLTPGHYQVGVYCPEALPYREELDIGDAPVSREWDVEQGLSIEGRVRGARGEPVPNIVVSVTPVGEPSDRAGTHCTTAEDGRFACTGLHPGDYGCHLADTPDPELVQISLEADSTPPFVLLDAPPVGTLRVSVAPDNAGGERSSLRVFARGADGAPVEGTPREGRFVFDRMPLGRYEVYASLPSTENPIIAHLERAEEVVDVAVPAARALSISGRAVDERGSPVLEAWVSASPSDPMARTPAATYPPTLTNERGEFELGGLAPGRFHLHVRNASGEGELREIAAGSTGVLVVVRAQSELAARP